MSIDRPKNEEELQKREAVGVIRASRFIRKYSQSHKSINVKTLCDIHKEIFRDAWPEISGEYRDENLAITGSELILPHFTKVATLMKDLDLQLNDKLLELKDCEGNIMRLEDELTDETIGCISKVIHTAAWLHHAVTVIHPFREGNGRTARLAGNLILERYGLVGISVKIEKENKNGYRKALVQIDKYKDYEPLETIISEGIIERYNGVPIRYYQ